MKAVTYQKYGTPDVLSISDLPKPEPAANEIQVKIHYTTVTSGDVRLRASDFPSLVWLPARLIFGLFKPKKQVLGHEFSGVVEEVGQDVSKFKVGDEVIGTTTMLPMGSYAEYVKVPEKWKSGVIHSKPNSLSFEESAALPIGSMTALFLLDKSGLDSKKTALIYGASGSVGTSAVQIAKIMADSVSAVCGSRNTEMVKKLGAASVMDYANDEYLKTDERYDVIFDAVGKMKKSNAKKLIRPGGKFVSVNMITGEKEEHISQIVRWADEGKIVPVIDREYSLQDVPDAHRYVDTGRKIGNVVIKVHDT
ncbi:MAG: NAD(P)-dependent alcohol dehydrogenase [Bacteroidota bacterium]